MNGFIIAMWMDVSREVASWILIERNENIATMMNFK